MKHAIRLLSLAALVAITLILGTADKATLAAIGFASLVAIGGTCGMLCALAGIISPEDRREANGEGRK